MEHIPEMGADKPVFVLDLERCLEKAVHDLQQFLVIVHEPSPIDIVQVQVEEALSLATFEHILQLSRFL